MMRTRMMPRRKTPNRTRSLSQVTKMPTSKKEPRTLKKLMLKLPLKQLRRTLPLMMHLKKTLRPNKRKKLKLIKKRQINPPKLKTQLTKTRTHKNQKLSRSTTRKKLTRSPKPKSQKRKKESLKLSKNSQPERLLLPLIQLKATKMKKNQPTSTTFLIDFSSSSELRKSSTQFSPDTSASSYLCWSAENKNN